MIAVRDRIVEHLGRLRKHPFVAVGDDRERASETLSFVAFWLLVAQDLKRDLWRQCIAGSEGARQAELETVGPPLAAVLATAMRDNGGEVIFARRHEAGRRLAYELVVAASRKAQSRPLRLALLATIDGVQRAFASIHLHAAARSVPEQGAWFGPDVDRLLDDAGACDSPAATMAIVDGTLEQVFRFCDRELETSRLVPVGFRRCIAADPVDTLSGL